MIFRFCATAVFLAFTVVVGAGTQGHAQEEKAVGGIVVQGTGEVKYTPDIARITLGVTTQNVDSEKAARDNADKTDALIRVVKAAGVVEKDIQTTNYSISPQYEYPKPSPTNPNGNPGPPVIVGYQVQNSVRVVVRKIKDAGKVIDAAIKAGANIAGGIDFDLNETDAAKAKDEALTRAVADARRKAIIIAKASQAGRIDLFGITEEGTNVVRPYAAPMMAMRSEAASTPIAAGEQTISATVTARYRIGLGMAANY